MKSENYLLIYLKGILMGLCDLVPGISGGTIAFITGIYERLIKSIHNISPRNKILLLKNITKPKEFSKLLVKFDFGFLSILLLGIGTAIIIGSKAIHYLLENYLVYISFFFIGLIIASSRFIYGEIKIHSNLNLLFGIIGFLIGLSLILFNETSNSNPSILFLFFSGFLAISAMLLPGISGSYILLILGTYTYVISIIKTFSFDILNLTPFFIGLIIGFVVISRVINFLFKLDKSKTLYLLLGFVIGSVSVLIKFSEILNYNLSIQLLITCILLLTIGSIIGFLIQKIK